jgi:hypothetical protein
VTQLIHRGAWHSLLQKLSNQQTCGDEKVPSTFTIRNFPLETHPLKLDGFWLPEDHGDTFFILEA